MFYFQVILMPDYDFPMSIKNHSEVLRCYTYLGIVFLFNNYF